MFRTNLILIVIQPVHSAHKQRPPYLSLGGLRIDITFVVVVFRTLWFFVLCVFLCRVVMETNKNKTLPPLSNFFERSG